MYEVIYHSHVAVQPSHNLELDSRQLLANFHYVGEQRASFILTQLLVRQSLSAELQSSFRLITIIGRLLHLHLPGLLPEHPPRCLHDLIPDRHQTLSATKDIITPIHAPPTNTAHELLAITVLATQAATLLNLTTHNHLTTHHLTTHMLLKQPTKAANNSNPHECSVTTSNMRAHAQRRGCTSHRRQVP